MMSGGSARWSRLLAGADLGRWALARSGYVPGTATSGRLRWHLAAHGSPERFGVRPGQRPFGRVRSAPPAGFEPAHTAPEAVALSPELWGLAGFAETGWSRRAGARLSVPKCAGHGTDLPASRSPTG